MVVLGQSGCIWVNVAVFGQGSCKRAMWLYSVKSGCIREKWF